MRQRPLTGFALVCALAACNRESPEPAAPAAAPQVATPHVATQANDPAMDSAALAGAADDADARPADLIAASTYRLPGPFSAATTEDWLRRRFGDANVHIADVPGGEGETSRGIVLFSDDPSRRAYLYFQDAEHLRGLSLVRILDHGSRWRLDNGIGIGTPLSRLVAMNGKPLRLSGFDWDYGGAISDWNGGRLQPADDDPQRAMIRLTHGDASNGAYPLGDAVFSSDDPRYPHLGEVAFVGEIGVSFPGEDDL